ncbi:hypothetical protein H257_15102 [Aphanomyces astaci]|uniref:Uncharacterized protein n=1 Tax=Aphanomyces astaci TaxID=112090 RepID=W4FQC7_APHAT|nr:hypothetical protein H257_15102 [Aphanomyces astaci]ETV69146.1 hypothetical protein H257_15102 [Aphanomyces astaci]|eukprot:XP_009841399.1 hypothetical protein H257_15102 [Aphanomyces astaci]
MNTVVRGGGRCLQSRGVADVLAGVDWAFVLAFHVAMCTNGARNWTLVLASPAALCSDGTTLRRVSCRTRSRRLHSLDDGGEARQETLGVFRASVGSSRRSARTQKYYPG